MGPELIDEQVQHVQLKLVEGKGDRQGRVFARGEFGHASNPTANGRLYRHGIWENNIARLEDNLKSKKVLGELDHPTDGRTALARASHVITDIRLDGDRVMGEAEILDTAKGRDLKAILEAGVPVGISSRGYGSTKPKGGVEEVQDDYKLVTFDFVAEPADPTAYPEAVFESGDGGAGALMMFEGVVFDGDADGDSDVPEAQEDESEEPATEGVPEPMSVEREQELAKKFAQRVLGTDGEPVSEETLRKEFASLILSEIEGFRGQVEQQVREDLMQDPEVGQAASILEAVITALRPLTLSEDASEMVEARDIEIRTLSAQIEELQQKLDQHEEVVEGLVDAAKEAGYKYHLERLLHEDDADVERLRSIVGDVMQYESADVLKERVETARKELGAIRLQEAEVQREQDSRTLALREKNHELAEGLREAIQIGEKLATENYAWKRLQTHPQGAKILRVLERSGMQSKEQVDALIEDFREAPRDEDDLEAARARVRARLQGGSEHLEEANASPVTGGTQNYNGLGASLGELKALAGMR